MIELITIIIISLGLNPYSNKINENVTLSNTQNQSIVDESDGTIWDIVITDDDNPKN